MDAHTHTHTLIQVCFCVFAFRRSRYAVDFVLEFAIIAIKRANIEEMNPTVQEKGTEPLKRNELNKAD